MTVTSAGLLASHKRILEREGLHPEYRSIVEGQVRVYSHEEATRLLALLKARFRAGVVRAGDGAWWSPCPACSAGEGARERTLVIRSATEVLCTRCDRGLEALLAHRSTRAQCEVCGSQEGLKARRIQVGRVERWVARCASCAPGGRS